jgi:hypothetical protein
LPGHGCHDKVASTGLREQDNYRAEQKGENSQKGKAYKAARAGQSEWTGQNKTARTELTGQDCLHRAAKIRQPRQEKKERTAEKTVRTGQLDRIGRSIKPEGAVRTGHPGQGKQTGETEQDC